MSANTTPIFVLTPNEAWGVITTANTAMDGTGSITTVFTAGTNGSRIDEIRIMSLGTNVQTTLRIFINNGNSNTTASNNTLIYDITIPATTASNNSQLTSTVITPKNLVIHNGYKLIATIGTTVAAGIQVTIIGGDF